MAELYGVTIGNLNKAVTRYTDRLCFCLTREEYKSLRFQFGSLNRVQHSKYMPRALPNRA
ncbi:ORF6N domain-containing protein [candidate division KSB1 bacterium]|nr:ORF6N domain-containing protein [candidate division KSB1 bacterium]